MSHYFHFTDKVTAMQRGSDDLSGHCIMGIPALISHSLVQGTTHCPQETTYHVSFPLTTDNCLSLLLSNIPYLLLLPPLPIKMFQPGLKA